MQKHLAIGQGIKILDQKTRGGGSSTNPPASLRVKSIEDTPELQHILLLRTYYGFREIYFHMCG